MGESGSTVNGYPQLLWQKESLALEQQSLRAHRAPAMINNFEGEGREACMFYEQTKYLYVSLEYNAFLMMT